MSFKNSFKLLTTNFSIVWKQLLYYVLISLFSFGIASCIFLPTVRILVSEGVIAQFKEIFETIYTNPRDVIQACKNATTNMVNTLSDNFSTIGLNVIFSLFFAKIVFDILKYMSFYNVTNIMYMKLTSNLEIGYTSNFISNLWAEFKYAIARFIYTIPFDIIYALLIYGFLSFVNGTITILIGLFLFILLFTVISALKITFFTAHATTMFEKQINPFHAFIAGNKKIAKNFLRILSNSIIVVITIIVSNLILGIFTVGSGLLITIPMSFVFLAIFNLTSYFGASGERYYLSETIIVNPQNSDNV